MHSRARVIGWALDRHLEDDLAIAALEKWPSVTAVRRPEADPSFRSWGAVRFP